MAIELVTSWTVLMRLAKELGAARMSGDEDAITKAKEAHSAYEAMCLRADRMIGLDIPAMRK